MKKAYHYLFYKLYKFSEAAPSRWMSDWKAELAIDILEIFLGFSGVVYYTVYTKQLVDLGNTSLLMLIFIAIVALPNYFIFHHKDQWKQYVQEFDKWSKSKNMIGALIVWSIVILIVANFIFAFYLKSQIDWTATPI